jgi:PAS domain S-box-containing protein
VVSLRKFSYLFTKSIYIEKLKPFFAGALVFVIAMVLTQYLAYQRWLIVRDADRQSLLQETNTVRERMQIALSHSLSATKTLAFIVEEYGTPTDFDRVAREILGSNPYIDALQLTREGVITHVYPTSGNVDVLGYDVLEDQKTSEEARKAIERKALYFAGPLKFRQGGVGVVGRLPIFKDNEFWGFSAVLIRLETLLAAVGIDTSENVKYVYQLSKIDPGTSAEEYFLSTEESYDLSQAVSVEVPNGEWRLHVMDREVTRTYDAVIFASLGFLLSLTAGFFAWSLVKQPIELNRLVNEKTLELTVANRQLESIINSLPGIFYAYDRKGKFARWNRNFEIVSEYSREEVSRMHPLQFYEGDEKDLLDKRIKAVFDEGQSEVQAHFVTRSGKRIPYYFNGRKASFNGVDYLIGMGIDITDRVKVENEMIERTHEIQRLSTHLQAIREEERTRIAREIHDELGQQLTGLKMDASWIDKKMMAEPTELIRDRLSAMIALIDETVKTVRRISSELRPGILDDLGLVAALEWQCQEFEKRTGIESHFKTDESEYNLEKNLSTNIFRVYQEALTNVARHANASKLVTSLSRNTTHLILNVKDNGVGFDMEEARRKKSLGLVGMRERAILFKGELTINSRQGEGTSVRLSVPLTMN